MARLGCTVLVVATLIAVANGFVAPSPLVAVTATSRIGTELYSSPPADRPVKDLGLGEASRKFRRNVYTHDDWKRYRSPDRFRYYLFAIFRSGVYKNLAREVTATTAVATFIFLYNMAVGGYVDFEGVEHAALITSEYLPKIGLPLAPFTLASPSLGLLLGMSVVGRL